MRRANRSFKLFILFLYAACISFGCAKQKSVVDVAVHQRPEAATTQGAKTVDINPADTWGPGDPRVCSSEKKPVRCTSNIDCYPKNGKATGAFACVAGGCNGAGYCELAGTVCNQGNCPGCPGGPCTEKTQCTKPYQGIQVCTYVAGNNDPNECETKRNCPTGFACEGRSHKTCVDRRLPCSINASNLNDANCPPGNICNTHHQSGSTGGATAFCANAMPFCSSDSDCGMGYFNQCLDVYRSGSAKRCYPHAASSNACNAHADCKRGAKCGLILEQGQWRRACTAEGRSACRSKADCPPGFACIDLDDSGTLLCMPQTGCSSDTQCGVNSRCMVLPGDKSTKVCACFNPGTNEPRACSL